MWNQWVQKITNINHFRRIDSYVPFSFLCIYKLGYFIINIQQLPWRFTPKNFSWCSNILSVPILVGFKCSYESSELDLRPNGIVVYPTGILGVSLCQLKQLAILTSRGREGGIRWKSSVVAAQSGVYRLNLWVCAAGTCLCHSCHHNPVTQVRQFRCDPSTKQWDTKNTISCVINYDNNNNNNMKVNREIWCKRFACNSKNCSWHILRPPK